MSDQTDLKTLPDTEWEESVWTRGADIDALEDSGLAPLDSTQPSDAFSASFAGEFAPPRMGSTQNPILIGGYGSIELTNDGKLICRGYKLKSNSLVTILFFFVAFGVGVALAVWIGGLLNLDSETSSICVLVSLVPFFGYALRDRKSEGVTAKPLEFRIPLENITVMTSKPVEAQADKIVLSVKKYKPRGTIHFYPHDEDVEQVLDAIQRAQLQAIGTEA